MVVFGSGRNLVPYGILAGRSKVPATGTWTRMVVLFLWKQNSPPSFLIPVWRRRLALQWQPGLEPWWWKIKSGRNPGISPWGHWHIPKFLDHPLKSLGLAHGDTWDTPWRHCHAPMGTLACPKIPGSPPKVTLTHLKNSPEISWKTSKKMNFKCKEQIRKNSSQNSWIFYQSRSFIPAKKISQIIKKTTKKSLKIQKKC